MGSVWGVGVIGNVCRERGNRECTESWVMGSVQGVEGNRECVERGVMGSVQSCGNGELGNRESVEVIGSVGVGVIGSVW